MDTLMSLVLLLACARAQSEPLREALQRRSDAFGVYANEYTRGYEPMAFAAVPLHAPMPVIHIISTAPLPMTRYPPTPQTQRSRIPPYNPSPSYSHHVSSFLQAPNTIATSYAHQTHYRQPSTYPHHTGSLVHHPGSYDHLNAYDQPKVPYDQVPVYGQLSMFRQPSVYASAGSHPMNAEPTEIEDEPPTILYARPQPNGGYTYHRKPSKKRVPPKKKEPVIIRVHKYRVVKGR